MHKELITEMSQRCVVRGWPVVLQEVNETISFCCARATKHTFPSFVKIACRSATIGNFSHSIPENDFSVASVSNTPYFV